MSKQLSICVVGDFPEANPDFNPRAYVLYFGLGLRAKLDSRDPFDDGESFKYGYASAAFRDGYYGRTLDSPRATIPTSPNLSLFSHLPK